MNRIQRLALAGTTALALAACSAGGTTTPAITQVNPSNPNYSKLQLAVGTANIYGATTGLNVVSTLRQPNGASALGVDTPTLTGAFAYATTAAPAGANGNDPYATLYATGPSIAEATATSAIITGTPQTVHPGTPFCDYTGTLPTGSAINASATYTKCLSGIAPNASTFGQSGGVFAMGLAPYNHVASTGQSYSYAPYAQPFFDTQVPATLTGQAAPYIPWGGPPAFDPNNDHMGTRDGLGVLGTDSFGDPYFLGVAEGITAFENVTPATGTYTLTVQIAAVGNNGAIQTSSVSASALLPAAGLVLPALTAPTITPDGAGGATFTMALPAGVSDGYVQIVDFGPSNGPIENPNGAKVANCQGGKGTSFAPVYYTIHVVPGTTTYTLPATNGPNTNTSGGTANLTPSPSLCTAAQNTTATGTATPADNFTVQAIGFDYPVYQAALSLTQATTTQTPAIGGPGGQSDVTISLPNEQQYQTGSQVIVTAAAGRHTAAHAIAPQRRAR
ncbi:MAG: hypothetical protein JO164_11490 [Candidatus Eremiobacteraeota bacterium]|nr:hypothetical protein [Candidatus Eremiobacteraeota bacterium]